jgi:hypothetical protein
VVGEGQMLRAVSGEPTQTRSSPWWRQAATLLGVIGLFVTLLFNTLAVRQSARQDSQAREAAQISLLTELNSNASNSERAISQSGAPDTLCDPHPPPPDARDSASLHEALDYYEYLSWLFNHDRLTVTGARDFFGGRMIDGWRLGSHLLGEDELRVRYRQLARFVRDTSRDDAAPDGCPGR